ncbi:hypothetical protein NDU88_001537 [Pleurodeles waltl]|uniref:Uncharacterized protein n=1 Tax=Pleurodeles waltl TaxID=8319 RepID=A0AAV7TIJ6_PLEWA|nr:hypothetical protein NDU88_001537 [Pleurodeles waltl]
MPQTSEKAVESPCEEPRNPDLGRTCPGGTVDGIRADLKEEGVVKQRIHEKDAEPSGVLNAEQDKGRRKWFPQEKRCRRWKGGRTDWLQSGKTDEEDEEERCSSMPKWRQRRTSGMRAGANRPAMF